MSLIESTYSSTYSGMRAGTQVHSCPNYPHPGPSPRGRGDKNYLSLKEREFRVAGFIDHSNGISSEKKKYALAGCARKQ